MHSSITSSFSLLNNSISISICLSLTPSLYASSLYASVSFSCNILCNYLYLSFLTSVFYHYPIISTLSLLYLSIFALSLVSCFLFTANMLIRVRSLLCIYLSIHLSIHLSIQCASVCLSIN